MNVDEVFALIIAHDAVPPAALPVYDTNELGFGPLHVACVQQQLDWVVPLLSAGAKVNAKTTHLASNVESRRNRVVRPKSATFYLPTGHTFLPPGFAADKGQSPLHLAARKGDVEVMRALLAAKANPSLLDGAGATPLHHAAHSGNPAAVQLLIETGKSKVDAATRLAKSASFYDPGMTALFAALETGNVASVELLLEAGADPMAKTKFGCSAMFFAARGGNASLIQRMLDLGVRADEEPVYKNEPLMEAIDAQSEPAVRLLMTQYEYVAKGARYMYQATELNELAIRQTLVEFGIPALEHEDIVAAARCNDTTFISAYLGDLDVVKSGRTALTAAASAGRFAAAKLLMDKGADINANPSGTALHRALQSKCDAIVDMLLDAGADCSLVDEHGNNALFTATLGHAHPRVAEMVKFGGDPYLHNRHGVSAYSMAVRDGDDDLVTLFETVEDTSSHLFEPWTDPSESAVLNDPPTRDWKLLHSALWDELVPPSGEARTVQGELVRLIGRLTDEAYRNGNMNFDDRHRGWIQFLKDHLNDGTFSTDEEGLIGHWCRELLKCRSLDLSGDGSPHYLLNEKVIAWCLAHPTLAKR